MNLLITSGNSYFGQHLVPLAQAAHSVIYTYFSRDPRGAGVPLDVRDGEAVAGLIARERPDAILHLSGSNRTPDMARVIVDGSRHVRDAAARWNCRLIFMSTDVVFNGRSAPYTDSDPPQPLHAYGRAKAAAEAEIAQYANHVIVRPSLIYSLTEMDMGTRWMREALAAGQPVRLFTDQIRQPVWTTTLAEACLELAEHSFTGPLNVVGDQPLTRAEFGQRMLGWWQVAGREQLTSGPTPPNGNWPKDLRIDTTRAGRLLKTPLLGVDAVIALHQ